jgi:hypothetical protein
VLKHCAAKRKRRLSALPNVGPYTYVKISGLTRSSIYIYIYNISRLRVKQACSGQGSSVGIETGYRLDGLGIESR